MEKYEETLINFIYLHRLAVSRQCREADDIGEVDGNAVELDSFHCLTAHQLLSH